MVKIGVELVQPGRLQGYRSISGCVVSKNKNSKSNQKQQTNSLLISWREWRTKIHTSHNNIDWTCAHDGATIVSCWQRNDNWNRMVQCADYWRNGRARKRDEYAVPDVDERTTLFRLWDERTLLAVAAKYRCRRQLLCTLSLESAHEYTWYEFQEEAESCCALWWHLSTTILWCSRIGCAGLFLVPFSFALSTEFSSKDTHRSRTENFHVLNWWLRYECRRAVCRSKGTTNSNSMWR